MATNRAYTFFHYLTVSICVFNVAMRSYRSPIIWVLGVSVLEADDPSSVGLMLLRGRLCIL